MPTILRPNVDYAVSICKPRGRKPYGYGGVWVKNDINRTTDCSGIVTHVLDAVINGERGMKWSRHGLSTEAYRYVGGNEFNPNRGGAKGPFGTIRVLRPQDIPANAVVKIGLQHGVGGGANSHMACTLMGVNIESRGGTVAQGGGQWYGGQARGYNHSLFRDWFYLPGDLVGSGTVDPVSPTAPGAVYLGQDCARYTCEGDKVLKLQQVLNRNYEAYSALDEDGEFGPATAAVVTEFQIRSGITADGVAGPATLAALGISFPTQEVPPVTTPRTDRQVLESIAADVSEIRAQLGEGHPSWPKLGVDKAGKPLTVRNAIAKLLGADV